MKPLLTLIALLTLSAASPVETASKLLADGYYVAVIDLLEGVADSERVAGERIVISEDVYPAALSAVGLYEQAETAFAAASDQIKTIQGEDGPPPAGLADRFAGASAVDALPAILVAAKERRIVMLNEAHHISRHRAFAAQVLRGLKAQGFTHFAAETFTPSIRRFASDGTLRRGDGTYLYDPVFAELVREARRLGFVLVPYEQENAPKTVGSSDDGQAADPIAQGNAREAAQARNLYMRVFRQNPKAKLFVYVGYGHLYEQPIPTPDGRSLDMMALRLKRLSGFDPLTIDQAATASGDNPVTRYLRTTLAIARPSAVRMARGDFLSLGMTDIVLIDAAKPDAAGPDGRPGWLHANGTRCPLTVSPPGEGRRLVQAFLATDPADAIPVDQVLVSGDAPPVTLLLPAGSYRLNIQTSTGTLPAFASRRIDCPAL